MMSQPILAISLFFHLLATVFWIGGLVTLTVLVWPEPGECWKVYQCCMVC
jgi:uncharacterized membrane protein